MNKKVNITVDYYKPSGKWYADEKFETFVPTKFDGEKLYEARNRLKTLIQDEMPSEGYIGVVRYTEDVEEAIGFPMMVR